MKAISVSQVNEYIARKLREDYNLSGLPVEGEVSGVSSGGGHLYFSLKDAKSVLRCAVWASYRKQIDESVITNGAKILVIGDISPYARGGSYSLVVKHAEAAGEGDLMKEFLRVKELLRKEGLFAAEHKRPLPSFPACVGVVTSESGAAIEDIKKIICRKNDYADILLFPALVQGAEAPASICRAIACAGRLYEAGRPIDVLIVGRGGGSPEDLAAFNDEAVARAIYASPIPVISAVGHESDTSIADYVADFRAETPTAAADLAVPDTFALREQIEDCRTALSAAMRYRFRQESERLHALRQRLRLAVEHRLREARLMLERSLVTLRESDPQRILSKGYAYVCKGDELIHSPRQIRVGESYEICLASGGFTARAETIRTEEKHDEG